MTTRRDPNPATDDALPRILSHGLQKTGGHGHRPNGIGGNLNGHFNGAHSTNSAFNSNHKLTDHAAKPSSSLRQVVLVDRDIDSLRDIAIALREEYDFHITISGNEALALLHDGAVDTIVVGQTLYSSTGLNVLAAARRSAPSTRRVLLANAVEASGIDRSGVGAAPFLLMHRPCTADKLRELLEEKSSPDDDDATSHSPIPLLSNTATRTPTSTTRSTTASNASIKPAIATASKAAPVNIARSTTPLQTPAPNTNNIDPNDYEHVVMESLPELPRRKARTSNPISEAHLPVVIYTDNSEFYQGICSALQDRHDVRLATQIERVVEFAEIGQCPVLITDRAGTQVELQRISIAVRTVEPALVLITSGTMQDGLIFRKLISAGVVHSFLPKPLSPQLVRLAVEGAKRHHVQLKNPLQLEVADDAVSPNHRSPSVSTRPAPAPLKPQPTPIYIPTDFGIDNYQSFDWRRVLPFAGIAAALILIAGGGWYGWQRWNQVDPIAVAIKENLQRAQTALDAGELTTPAESSAAHYYHEVLARDPHQATATQGLQRIAETLVEQTERALVDEDLDKATLTLSALRELEPANKRLSYLDAQLNKARSYQQQSRERVTTKNAASAATTRAAAESSAYTPISNQTQRQQAVTRWLSTAQQRLSQDQLIRPENDSAEFYLRQVERADPDNAQVQPLLRQIGTRLLAEAQEAVSRQQMETARRRLNDAARFGGDTATINRLQREIDAAANASSRTQYLRLVLQRTRDNQLLEPDRDSAKYYLEQLQRMDTASAETEQATRTLGLRLIDSANQAASQQQFNTAIRLLSEARQIGFNGPELNTAEAKVRAARTPTPSQSNVKPLSAAPKVIKTVSPKFPEEALNANVSGWVDVSFRITASGNVEDAVAVNSDPPGPYAVQFQRAAVAAIRQYKFEARNISDADTTQRMTVRMQFKLQ